jgi:acetolactate synthase-1/2/3 large subunit
MNNGMQKLSDIVISRFVKLGVTDAFSVTGGASMHLNDSVGENPNIQVMYMHNEQSCAMAAEGFARISRRPALVVTTAGPGAINTLNGVFGAFTDSIPMIVIAGQARTNTMKATFGLNDLRQLGDQEAPMLNMVSEITKKQFYVDENIQPSELLSLIDQAYVVATSGRPGPVWIEIPVDVQAKILNITLDEVEKFKLTPIESMENTNIAAQINVLLEKIRESKRPVFLLGSGVQISNTSTQVIDLAETLNIPILTAWSHDIIDSSHPLFMGRPGTIGTRPGNFVLQQSDLIIVLGSRLNIRQISYNWGEFAKNSYLVQVDIDAQELDKPFPVKIDLPIHSSIRNFLNQLSKSIDEIRNLNTSKWLAWCKEIKSKYDLNPDEYPESIGVINPYKLIPYLIDLLPKDSTIVCGDATACIVPFQTAKIRDGLRMFSNSGCASMGYDLPAALGAATANKEVMTLCFAGDGSLMMNIQELQTLHSSNLNIKLIILDNGGYLSIKQTQSNFFGRQHGSSPVSGVTFPDFAKVAQAFGLSTFTLTSSNWKKELVSVLNSVGPQIIIAKLDTEQEFIPRLKSKIIDGVITTPQLDDMFPHLHEDELAQVRLLGQSVNEN